MKPDPDLSAQRERAIERFLAHEGVDRLVPVADPGAVRRIDDHAEYAKARQVWEELGELKSDPEYAALLGRPTLRERLVQALGWLRNAPVYGKAVAASGAIALAVFGVHRAMTDTGERFTTQIAETRQLAFQDGTQVALGPKSTLAVAFTDARREVVMTPGEAYFSVSHDPTRPFVITAGGTHITVVGTKFNVKYDATGVRVSVVEGLVRVSPPATAFTTAQAIAVSAGMEAVIPVEAEPLVFAAMPSASPDSWRTGQLDYNDASLASIVEDLNRYLPGHIRVESDQLARATLTASFRADQAAQFLATLPGVLPLELDGRIGDDVVLRDRNPGTDPAR